MARSFKAVLTATGRGWSFNDVVTDESHLIVELPTDSATVTRLALYGLKQAVADGGARAKGTSRAARVTGMEKRYEQIIDGSWDFRDGTGTGALPDADAYRAMIGLGITEDSAERRMKWKELKPAQRRAIAAREDVKAWIAANVEVDEDAAEEAVAAFMA